MPADDQPKPGLKDQIQADHDYLAGRARGEFEDLERGVIYAQPSIEAILLRQIRLLADLHGELAGTEPDPGAPA